MARVCQVTGKGPMVGNNVSHANNKTKRRFLPNLQNRRIFVESENRWVSLRLSNAGLRPSFGPSWTLLSPGADLSVGTWGLEDALETFVAARPAWRRLPR